MDFFESINTINRARELYAQARAALQAQEETQAIAYMNICVQRLCAAEDRILDSDELAELLETDIGTLEDFRAELNGAAVRQAFMSAAKSARQPHKALQYIEAIEETHRLFADEGIDFDEFCHDMGIEREAFEALKAEINERLDHGGWESGGARLVNGVVAASLRRAFKWAAEHAKSEPGAALKVIDAVEWVAAKAGGSDRRQFYQRASLDENLIARVRNAATLRA
jgi:hypothetical protein